MELGTFSCPRLQVVLLCDCLYHSYRTQTKSQKKLIPKTLHEQLSLIHHNVHINDSATLQCINQLFFMADGGMAMEEERELTAGLFTELNIHNQFDWVENNNQIPQHKSIGFVDTLNEQKRPFMTHITLHLKTK